MDARPPAGRAGRGAWLAAAALLVAAGVAIPYGLLAGPNAGLAVAGFWLGFGLATAALIWIGLRTWRG